MNLAFDVEVGVEAGRSEDEFKEDRFLFVPPLAVVVVGDEVGNTDTSNLEVLALEEEGVLIKTGAKQNSSNPSPKANKTLLLNSLESAAGSLI